MISDEEKDQVRAASDLVAIVQETVELKPRGHEFWGCCPFHGEKTPSFHIIPATQVWHCFGCGEGGDVFTYIMKRENLSFPESIRYLADRAGIELHDIGAHRERGTKRARIYDLCAETAQFYHTMLMRGKDSRPREYFASRGMGGDVCRRYCLGFAPGRNALVSHLSQAGFTPQEMIDANVAVSRGRGQLADRFYDRVMFPIFDEQGHNIAFGGRIMGDGQPKYLNTAETSVFHKKRNLYGFNWAKEFIVAQDTAIVVEGYTDCIACWEAGIKNVVATLGTALTEHHVKTLTRFAKRIVYMFDGDAAGQKAARRAIQFIEQDSMDLRCVVLPDGNDPMEFITAHGGEALQARYVNMWKRAIPEAELYNMYGPTETTVDCAALHLTRTYRDDEPIPIGRACRNMQLLLLKDDLTEAAPGETGELCVRGSGLAAGYFADAEKTNSAFIQNPLCPDYRDILYRTGDMAVQREDGNFYFLARRDGQIKHMGYRIELGEIETALYSVKGLHDAVCFYDAMRDRIVCVYAGDLDTNALARALRTALPKYMLPNVYEKLDALPHNANGKLDRAALKERFLHAQS